MKPDVKVDKLLIPKTIDDLAVNSKKIKEVEIWLQENVVTRSSKLFVSKRGIMRKHATKPNLTTS